MKPLPRLHLPIHAAIFDITDEIRSTSLRPESLSAHQWMSVCQRLCRGLTMSLDNGLAEAIYAASDIMDKTGNRQEAEAIVSDAESFLVFLNFERDALIAAGARPDTAEAICQKLKDTRSQLKDYRLDPAKLIETIREFRRAACTAGEETSSAIKSRRKFVEDVQRTTFTYGTSIVVANCVITAVTLGASVVFSGLSVTAGGLLAGAGTRVIDKSDKPGKF